MNDGKASIEEIGQRILTALKKNIGPKWILFNLAGLYWRIIGNNYHGVECFRRAIYTAPDKYWDVPETNMANILYRWGRYDDALQLATFARVGNEYEVSCFGIGELIAQEPVCVKTNNLGSNQIQHKLGCTVIEDGYSLEILDLERRIVLSV